MAADSKCTYTDVGSFNTSKLYRHEKSIFGEAGDMNGSLLFRRWVLDGMPKKRPAYEREREEHDFIVLELAPDGLWIWDAAHIRQPVKQDVYAIGSGRKVAMYCTLVLGMEIEKAVEEAAKTDDFTGGPVCVMKLET